MEQRQMGELELDGRVLDHLFEVIESRRDDSPETSHTAKLFSKGVLKIAQKVGEEATETVIEGVAGSRDKLADESADLLYHLLVLWAARGLKPNDIWRQLEGRKGISGIAEKSARGLSGEALAGDVAGDLPVAGLPEN
jgi:phosphoribosyl-ATP pyrophosphohydrolase